LPFGQIGGQERGENELGNLTWLELEANGSCLQPNPEAGSVLLETAERKSPVGWKKGKEQKEDLAGLIISGEGDT